LLLLFSSKNERSTKFVEVINFLCLAGHCKWLIQAEKSSSNDFIAEGYKLPYFSLKLSASLLAVSLSGAK